MGLPRREKIRGGEWKDDLGKSPRSFFLLGSFPFNGVSVIWDGKLIYTYITLIKCVLEAFCSGFLLDGKRQLLLPANGVRGNGRRVILGISSTDFQLGTEQKHTKQKVWSGNLLEHLKGFTMTRR